MNFSSIISPSRNKMEKKIGLGRKKIGLGKIFKQDERKSQRIT